MKKSLPVVNPIFEYNYISDGIYIGTNSCCQMPFFHKKLLKKGVGADISLEENRVDEPFGIKYFLWLPVKDKTAPTIKQLKLGVEVIKQLISMKVKVYVHCLLGHGRSPTLVAAYYINQGMEVMEAIDFLIRKRPTIHLEKTQIKKLKEYAKIIKNTK